MTTKKKAAPKAEKKATAAKGTTAKALTEPAATTTRASMKAEKAPKKAATAVAPKAEAPVAPTVVATVTMIETKVEQAPVVEVAVSTEKPVLTIGMFQKRLHERGYYHGWWDGHYGPMTKHAVASFQAANGLHPDGEPTPATLEKLGF